MKKADILHARLLGRCFGYPAIIPTPPEDILKHIQVLPSQKVAAAYALNNFCSFKLNTQCGTVWKITDFSFDVFRKRQYNAAY
jgi:hypothetical protein